LGKSKISSLNSFKFKKLFAVENREEKGVESFIPALRNLFRHCRFGMYELLQKFLRFNVKSFNNKVFDGT